MEFSKQLLNRSWIAVVVLTTLVAVGSFLNFEMEVLGTLAALSWGELATVHAFYFWKAKNENRIKVAKQMMGDWAGEYGVESVSVLAEIILKE